MAQTKLSLEGSVCALKGDWVLD